MYKSSKNPRIAIGKQYKNEYDPMKYPDIEEKNANTIPPPFGVGIECELLWLGLSRMYFFKYGFINLKEI